MLEIRNRKTLQSKVNICKSDVKIGDYADSLLPYLTLLNVLMREYIKAQLIKNGRFARVCV